MGQIQAGLTLFAVNDGTSVNGYLRVEPTPLIQRYNDAGVFTPDFESLAENMRPTVVPIITDVASGQMMTPQTLTWKYNGVALTFGDDGLSTNEGMEGTFKRLTDYSTSYDGQTKVVAALRVMKNLVPISGYDNDRSGDTEEQWLDVRLGDRRRRADAEREAGDAAGAAVERGKHSERHERLHVRVEEGEPGRQRGFLHDDEHDEHADGDGGRRGQPGEDKVYGEEGLGHGGYGLLHGDGLQRPRLRGLGDNGH